MSETKVIEKKNKSSFSFFEGAALIELAKTYPKIIDVLYECVQNALDSNAPEIIIKVDQKQRIITVADNGDGVSLEKFEKALTSVGHTIKREHSLGQFGLGLISPLGKCEKFTFISTPKNETSAYKEWRFETEAIKKQRKIDSIPMEEKPELIFNRAGGKPPLNKTFVSWRTLVKLVGITTDRTVSRVDVENLKEEILIRFAAKMRRTMTTITIAVKRHDGTKEQLSFSAPEFSGEKLPILVYEQKKESEASFEMYLARKTPTGRKGVVHMGIKFNDYRINFSSFVRDHNLLTPEAIDVLSSGIFEGTILSRNCRLVKERTHFEENDALVLFCVHIEKWVKDVGAKYAKQINDEKEDERFQKLGVKSLQKFEELFKKEEFQNLLDVLKNIKEGTIGPGHVDYHKSGKINDFSELEILVSGGKEDGEPVSVNGSSTPRQDAIENRDHNTAAGPRGTRRKIVKHQGTGLRYIYEEMHGKFILWIFELKTGILRFNIHHPLWKRAEKKDSWLMQFQEMITLAALTIETVPKEQRQVCQNFALAQISAALFFIENR